MKRYSYLLAAGVGLACGGPDVDSNGPEAENPQSLSGGTTDTDLPQDNAVVALSFRDSGCTGTLVSRDIILTAGHCFDHPPPAGSTATGDWETPGLFYPFSGYTNAGDRLSATFGADRAMMLRPPSESLRQKFTLEVVGGGTLEDGSSARLKSGFGLFVVAENGGGSFVGANRPVASTWETFTVTRAVKSGGATAVSREIQSGNRVRLRAPNGMFVRLDAKKALVADVAAPSNAAEFEMSLMTGSGAMASGSFIRLTDPTSGERVAANSIPLLDYSIAGYDDIRFVRLAIPAPSDLATPMEILHRVPGIEFGSASVGPASFCTGNQVCLTGDFDGDGKTDLLALDRFSDGKAYVALSDGQGFAAGQLWGSGICKNLNDCQVGDVNDDGRDDVVIFVRTVVAAEMGKVYVSLSTGSGFMKPALWKSSFCAQGSNVKCRVADVNGDGRADAIAINAKGDVRVALSTGAGFGATKVWKTALCPSTRVCQMGDVNGDRKADVVAFAKSAVAGTTKGDVYVALSSGSSFESVVKWHDYFCVGNEVCRVGDFDGDGKADIAAFLRGTDPQVYVALSSGFWFGDGNVWHGYFCAGNETCATGDFNGDGRDDVVAFVRNTATEPAAGDVWVAQSTPPADANAYFQAETFIEKGYGSGGGLTRYRATTAASFLTMPHPSTSQFYGPNMMQTQTLGNASILGGDSGGPFIWWNKRKNASVVVGACQGPDRHVSTFGTGGPDAAGAVHADIATWVRNVLGIN